jgi:hypothetical protein
MVIYEVYEVVDTPTGVWFTTNLREARACAMDQAKSGVPAKVTRVTVRQPLTKKLVVDCLNHLGWAEGSEELESWAPVRVEGLYENAPYRIKKIALLDT